MVCSLILDGVGLADVLMAERSQTALADVFEETLAFSVVNVKLMMSPLAPDTKPYLSLPTPPILQTHGRSSAEPS